MPLYAYIKIVLLPENNYVTYADFYKELSILRMFNTKKTIYITAPISLMLHTMWTFYHIKKAEKVFWNIYIWNSITNILKDTNLHEQIKTTYIRYIYLFCITHFLHRPSTIKILYNIILSYTKYSATPLTDPDYLCK